MFREGEVMVDYNTSSKKKNGIHCQRCHGLMGVEKFYGQHTSYFGWHCFICGDILDPVILLHRLTGDAKLPIPDSEDKLLSLIKKYVRAIPRGLTKGGKFSQQ
jgi:hypothetical protein